MSEVPRGCGHDCGAPFFAGGPRRHCDQVLSLDNLMSELKVLCRREVEDGAATFDPTPADSRALIASCYSAPSSLLVEFLVRSFACVCGMSRAPDVSAMCLTVWSTATFVP